MPSYSGVNDVRDSHPKHWDSTCGNHRTGFGYCMPVHAARADAFASCFVMLIVRNDLRDLRRLTIVSRQPKRNEAKLLIVLSNPRRQRVQATIEFAAQHGYRRHFAIRASDSINENTSSTSSNGGLPCRDQMTPKVRCQSEYDAGGIDADNIAETCGPQKNGCPKSMGRVCR